MKKYIYVFVLTFTFLLNGCSENEAVVDIENEATVLKVITSEIETQNLNAVSFCVVKEDSVLWSFADGYSDKSEKAQATTDTRFLVASISKSVTAVAALKLVEDGLLDLDADISAYLPFEVSNPRFDNLPITTRMLLNHSSSISDAHYAKFDFYCWNKDCSTPLGTFLSDFFASDGQFFSSDSFYEYSPGAQGNYSNMGYALLGYIVERAANQPFDEYCAQEIFMPLGMSKTAWRIADTPINELAVPYSPTITSSAPHYTFPDYPNGGIRTTPNDLSKYLRMLMNDGLFDETRIVSKQTLDLMKMYTLTLERGGLSFDFGLGMYYSKFKGKELFGHGGGEQGTSTAMHFDPESNVGVIVFTNTTSANLDLIVYTLYKFGTKQ